MIVRLKRTVDGAVLTAVRADETATPQRTRSGGFFALHDLAHMAVESVLALDDSFFGLLARGWDITTFEDKSDPCYDDVPPQAIVTEHIVAVISCRVDEPVRHDPDLHDLWCCDVNAEIAVSVMGSELIPDPIPTRILLDIARLLDILRQQWACIQPGDTLELTFPLAQTTNSLFAVDTRR